MLGVIYEKKKLGISESMQEKANTDRISRQAIEGSSLLDEIQDTAASQKQSKEHPYPLFNIDSNEHKSFMVDANINQVPASMEYDTGAALTLITKKTYERIRQRNHIKPLHDSDVQLRTYTGQLVPQPLSTWSMVRNRICYKYLWSSGRDQTFWVEIGLLH